MQRKDFYVYVHYRLTDDNPFYVGKGSGNRYLATGGRNPYWRRIVARHGFYSKILYSDLYQKQAYHLETETIKDLRLHGFNLANLTCGGDGGFGQESAAKVESAKANQRAAAKKAGSKRKGCKRSPETIEKMRKSMTGKKFGFSTKLKHSLRVRGENHPMYCNQTYRFWNYKTGKIVELSAHQFFELTNLPKSNIHRMVNGKLNSVGDWALEGTDLSTIKPVNIKRRFWHADHGEVTCTLTELQSNYGAETGNMSNVVAGKRKSCRGWKYLGPSVAQ